jgi:RND family efflux transporter MFP subunit
MRRAWPAVLVLTVVAGCQRNAAPQPAKAAEKPHVEADLARTTLTADAVKSLGVRSAPAGVREVQRQLRLSGWVMVPQGREVTLTAPVSGYVRAPKEGDAKLPVPGRPAGQGQELFQLEPVLTPVEQIQMATLKRTMENELNKAVENVSVAEKELTRVKTLHKQRLRGQQDLEQAQARLQNAQEDLQSARDRIKLFDKPAGSNGQLAPVPIKAPRGGTVLAVPVSPGQYVTATAPLLTVADLSELWLRVPVPEADLPRLDRKGAATVLLGSGKTLSVRPFAFVPQVDPARHTADLIYELPAEAKKRGLMAKDQMVAVDVPLDQRQEETVVPYDAVVFDAHAGAWIYLDKTAKGAEKHTYERRRVELGPRHGKEVAVRPAVAKGDRVVVEGAGVLFSREFYKP